MVLVRSFISFCILDMSDTHRKRKSINHLCRYPWTSVLAYQLVLVLLFVLFLSTRQDIFEVFQLCDRNFYYNVGVRRFWSPVSSNPVLMLWEIHGPLDPEAGVSCNERYSRVVGVLERQLHRRTQTKMSSTPALAIEGSDSAGALKLRGCQ